MKLSLQYPSSVLEFQLIDHPIAMKWAALVDYYATNKNYYLDYDPSYLQGDGALSEVQRKLMSCVRELQKHYPDLDFIEQSKVEFTSQDLNHLHKLYERLSVDPRQRAHNPEFSVNEIMGYLDQLNTFIHRCEELYYDRSRNLKKDIHGLMFRFLTKENHSPDVFKLPLEKDEKRLFTTVMRPGSIVLRYCISGRDVRETYRCGEPVDSALPLQHFSPGFIFLAGSAEAAEQKQMWRDIRAWLESAGYDSYHPDLTLGWLELGRLMGPMVDDMNLLTSTPSVSIQWSEAEHQQAQRWLKEIEGAASKFNGREAQGISSQALQRAKS